MEPATIGFVTATVVGVMNVAPNMCQVDLMNPDKTINTFQVKCEYIVQGMDWAGVPHRSPWGP